eukprot:scaffold8791_cov115-Skeletonema_dohrnii-CCMP3373.AAC.2
MIYLTYCDDKYPRTGHILSSWFLLICKRSVHGSRAITKKLSSFTPYRKQYYSDIGKHSDK